MSIILKNLTKKYNSFGNEITALNSVSLEFREGEFVAVTGESGSGKSTLLNALCGMLKLDSGEIVIDGSDITKLSDDELAKLRRSRVGVIYQFYNLIPELNVRDNITLSSELDGKEIDEAYLSEILTKVGLSGRERDFPSALSGGQQQRVAVARALYQRPALLLADEPTGNLDEKNTGEILDLLAGLNEEFKITLIVVTHSSAVAKRAKRIVSLENGVVVRNERI